MIKQMKLVESREHVEEAETSILDVQSHSATLGVRGD